MPCAFQLLVYPVTDHVEVSRSRELFSRGYYLDQAFMDLAVDAYLAPDVDRADADVSVQYAEKLPADLASALVVTAGFDPGAVSAVAGGALPGQRSPGLVD